MLKVFDIQVWPLERAEEIRVGGESAAYATDKAISNTRQRMPDGKIYKNNLNPNQFNID